jgi:hypothetical protein
MLTVGVAAWIARLLFVVLLVLAVARQDLGWRGGVIFAALGAFAWFALPYTVPGGGSYVTSALAILDIALVFVVFKGDVRIT